MRVVKLFLDDEKEEQWLNDMAQKGWHFKKFRFPFYMFEQGEPKRYMYRLELLAGIGMKEEIQDYLQFVESTGAEVVQKRYNWAYFRKETVAGAFELYSDALSKLSYTMRMYRVYLTILILNVGSMLFNGWMASEQQSYFNGFISSLNAIMVVLLLVPFMKVVKRKRQLKKQLELFEQ